MRTIPRDLTTAFGHARGAARPALTVCFVLAVPEGATFNIESVPKNDRPPERPSRGKGGRGKSTKALTPEERKQRRCGRAPRADHETDSPLRH